MRGRRKVLHHGDADSKLGSKAQIRERELGSLPIEPGITAGIPGPKPFESRGRFDKHGEEE
jgi:hypothetical protein